MNKKRVKLLALILWMIIIFVFSQMPGNVSDENSKFVIYIFNLLGLDLNSVFGSLANFAVRKGAHFTEYFILYMLFLNVLRDRFTWPKALVFSLLGVFLYACTDEFHQSFIPGRGPAFRDVLIDTSGGLVALTAVYIRSCFKKRNKGDIVT
ncbi:MAG: VanZ family protein [Bacillota bacterium]|nr:VanZ family protein [Bacillota bacterium]